MSGEYILDYLVGPAPAKNKCTKSTCQECGTASTPLWRKDDRSRNLCNACGIRWKRSVTAKSGYMRIRKPAVKKLHVRPTTTPTIVDHYAFSCLLEEANREWEAIVLGC